MSNESDKISNSNEQEEVDGLNWNPSIDTLLASWCDNSKCFEWMHTEAYSLTSKKAKIFMICINLLTALSGLSNVIVGGYTIDGFQISWVFGGISILVSSLNMLQDKLGYQQATLNHNKFANQWGIIRNKIEEIVSLPVTARRDCKTFLRYIKADINQASIEGNSLIPKSIRTMCYEKFKNIPNFDIPDICGNMEHTKVYINNSPNYQPLIHK
jgi:hypothetical protein